MISLIPRTLSTSVVFNLSPPIFDWNNTHSRFCEFVYTALMPEHHVSVDDFSTNNSLSLGENTARYNFPGTQSFISLSANKFWFDFAFHTLDDRQFIEQIIQELDYGFNSTFPKHSYESSEFITHGQYEISENSLSAIDYFENHKVPAFSKSFQEMNVTYVPGIRFTNKAKDESWSLNCTVETSALLNNGLFINFHVLFSKDSTFQWKVEKSKEVIDASLTTLGMEVSDGRG